MVPIEAEDTEPWRLRFSRTSRETRWSLVQETSSQVHGSSGLRSRSVEHLSWRRKWDRGNEVRGFCRHCYSAACSANAKKKKSESEVDCECDSGYGFDWL